MKEIVTQLKKYKTYALFCHISPDPDTIGSCQALRYALQKLGKEVDIYCDDLVRDREAFMFDNILSKQPLSKDYDMYVAIDCGASRLLGQYADIFKTHKNTIQIDHHASSEVLAQYVYNNPNSSSCALIIYDIINMLGIKIDKNMAYYLFCGISADTGGFKHGNTEPKAFDVASKLALTDIDYNDIAYRLYKKKNKNYIIYLKYAIKNYHQIENRFAYSIIKHRLYNKIKQYKNSALLFDVFTGADSDIFVNITETEKGKFDLSFRSQYANVGQYAREFGGGGHKNAAGCTYYGTAKSLINQLKAIIK